MAIKAPDITETWKKPDFYQFEPMGTEKHVRTFLVDAADYEQMKQTYGHEDPPGKPSLAFAVWGADLPANVEGVIVMQAGGIDTFGVMLRRIQEKSAG